MALNNLLVLPRRTHEGGRELADLRRVLLYLLGAHFWNKLHYRWRLDHDLVFTALRQSVVYVEGKCCVKVDRSLNVRLLGSPKLRLPRLLLFWTEAPVSDLIYALCISGQLRQLQKVTIVR